jgi:hypothetical protein
MMRASVLLLLAPIVIGVAGCRDNPGFGITYYGDDADPRDSTGGELTEGLTTETGEPAACAPFATLAPDDVCDPWEPAPTIPPNLAKAPTFNMDPCGSEADLFIRREGDLLVACGPGCNGCDETRSVDVGNASEYVARYGDLLPPDGACARLVHRSAALVDSADACNSTAYAVLDVDGTLRFAVAYADPDPFSGVAGLDLAVDRSLADECAGATHDACVMGGSVAPVVLGFTIGDCRIPETLHRSAWQGIVVAGTDYVLEVFSAFTCLQGGAVRYSWFLHQPL